MHLLDNVLVRNNPPRASHPTCPTRLLRTGLPVSAMTGTVLFIKVMAHLLIG
jgi:hypothetical protein